MEDSSPVAGAGVDMVEGKESLINPYPKEEARGRCLPGFAVRTSGRSRICVEMARMFSSIYVQYL